MQDKRGRVLDPESGEFVAPAASSIWWEENFKRVSDQQFQELLAEQQRQAGN